MNGTQLMQVWITGGGPAGWAALMAGIALAESGGTPSAVEPDQPYATTGWGLWQITPGDSEPQAGTNDQLLTPHRNAVAAVAKFHAQGLTAWRDDRTWTAWRNAGAPVEPTASKVAGYVASWGGSFGAVRAPSSSVSGQTEGASPAAPDNVQTAWGRLATYSSRDFQVQMSQWDQLTAQVERI